MTVKELSNKLPYNGEKVMVVIDGNLRSVSNITEVLVNEETKDCYILIDSPQNEQ